MGQGEQRLLLTAHGWDGLIKQATAILQEYHRKFPARLGMPKAELGSRLKLGKYSPSVWQRLRDEEVLGEEGLTVRLASYQVRLSQAQQNAVDAFLRSLDQNPYSPPSDQIPEPDVLSLLIEQGRVVKIGDGVVFAASVYDEMVKIITSLIQSQGKVSLAEVRDLFKTSRKYVQALLEHLDEKKITRRVGDERVLY